MRVSALISIIACTVLKIGAANIGCWFRAVYFNFDCMPKVTLVAMLAMSLIEKDAGVCAAFHVHASTSTFAFIVGEVLIRAQFLHEG